MDGDALWKVLVLYGKLTHRCDNIGSLRGFLPESAPQHHSISPTSRHEASDSTTIDRPAWDAGWTDDSAVPLASDSFTFGAAGIQSTLGLLSVFAAYPTVSVIDHLTVRYSLYSALIKLYSVRAKHTAPCGGSNRQADRRTQAERGAAGRRLHAPARPPRAPRWPPPHARPDYRTLHLSWPSRVSSGGFWTRREAKECGRSRREGERESLFEGEGRSERLLAASIDAISLGLKAPKGGRSRRERRGDHGGGRQEHFAGALRT